MTTATERSPAQILAIILAVVIQIGAPFLPSLGYGTEVGARSDAVRTIITPAGWAFSIWGPLYIGSIVFAIWQALPDQRNNALVDRIGWLAALAFAMQGVWAAYAQMSALDAVSVFIILLTLVPLLMILRIMTDFPRDFTTAERWIVGLVFSAHASWLTAATIVNITAMFVHYGLAGGYEHPLIGAALVVVGGLIAALAVVRSKGNPWYGLVFCWPLLAIFAQGGQASTAVAIACVIAGVLVIAAVANGMRVPANRARWLG